MKPWVVVLELGWDDPLELGVFEALVERLGEWEPIGTAHPDRRLLEMHVSAPGADEALRIATSNYQQAARAEGRSAPFTRAEVITWGEFELGDCDDAGSWAHPPCSRVFDALVCTELYDATRALIDAKTRVQITEILVRFVLELNGTVHVGRQRHLQGLVLVDLSVEPGQHLYATAPFGSDAGDIFGRCLPTLVEDAQRAARLLGHLVTNETETWPKGRKSSAQSADGPVAPTPGD